MKAFQTVMFVIAMVLATTQTMRHVYVKWIAPGDSVLDQFQSEVESDIATARDLDELVQLYADAKADVEAYEANPDNPQVEPHRMRTTEPYESEVKLKEAIERRERWQRKVGEVWFFWIAGAISIGIGAYVFRAVNAWLGMSGVLVGYAEMLFWTSPLLHRRFAGAEFETLLSIKLLLSAITLVSLIALWLLKSRGLLLTRTASGD